MTPAPRLIALDLDETTLNLQSRLSPRNRAALEAAIARGIEVVIASGRAFDTLPKEMTEFPGVHYAICGNGVAVYELAGGTPLVRYTLTRSAVERVLRLTAGENITYEAFWRGGAYAQKDYIEDPSPYLADEHTRRYIKASRRPVPDILDFIRGHWEELDSMDVVVTNYGTKERLMAALRGIPGVYVTTSVPRLIEISDQRCGKHRGLQFLSDYLGIPRELVWAFGNADNDADMLAWAGHGVAVANGSAACRAAADEITGDFLADGVAESLERMLEREEHHAEDC